MLSVLFWILAGIGILCVIVFPGKKNGALAVPEKEKSISDDACNIAVTAFILTQMLFPLYGYYMFYARYPNSDSTWKNNSFGEEIVRILTQININFINQFDNKPENSVYGFVVLTAVFCFFAGMSIYKRGVKTGHKIFLLIPLLTMAVTAGRLFNSYKYAKRKPGYFLLYEFMVQLDVIVRYLCGALFMIAVLYGIYLLLKKLLHNELIPLVMILILSFFAPDIRVIRDGVNIGHDAMLRIMVFGPDIPLFPIGMLVMKYKDKILPKTKKVIILHLVTWLCVGGISFYSLYGLQFFLIKQAGLSPTDALTDDWYDGLGAKLSKLEEIYKVDSIPWLIFCLAVSMLILIITLLVRTGNPVTKFFREHCYLISVLLFSRHVFFETGNHKMDLWTDTLGLPENLLIIVPFIYFALSVVLAFLINRFIRLSSTHRQNSGTR